MNLSYLKKDDQLKLNISAQLKDDIANIAAARGITVSAFVRGVLQAIAEKQNEAALRERNDKIEQMYKELPTDKAAALRKMNEALAKGEHVRFQ